MERSYYYLGGDELHSGMYVALIRRLEREGLVTSLIARARISPDPRSVWSAWKGRHAVGPNPIAELRGQIRGGVHQIPIFAPAPGLSAPLLARILLAPGKPAGRIVLHTRQIVMARLALTLRRWLPEVRVICELEGDPLAELDYIRTGVQRPPLPTRLRWSLEDSYYARQDRRMVRDSDAVLCVSHKLKEVLLGRYGLTGADAEKLLVFPSVGDPGIFRFDPQMRRELRGTLGLDGRYVVLYSGNLSSRWQVPDKLVEVFGFIRQRRENAYFLILTPEKHRPNIMSHLQRARVSPQDYGMHTSPHGEVVRYLCAADVGLFLRERHLSNQVAAPGKFSEYMLSGLPTIMTDGIGDFSEQVKGAEFACVLPDLDRLDTLKEWIQSFCAGDVTADQRLAQGRWAAERFSTDLRIPELAALYRRL